MRLALNAGWVGVAIMLRTFAYVSKGGPCYRMKDCCLAADGQGKDPNRFDVWVSAKLVGNVIATTDKTKGLFTDRLLLRRLVAGE